MTTASPFHAGERAVQRRLGVLEQIEPWAKKVVRPFLPEQHRAFYAALPFLVAAARDEEGRPWATLLSGEVGFADSPEPGVLQIAALPVPGDALEGSLRAGTDLGLLGIELATRRRNRVNGRVERVEEQGIRFAVEQAFGNCPQYIHEREWRRVSPDAARVERVERDALTPGMQQWIESAGTFFIATGHRGEGENAAYGMDASHRGGEPGFVRVESDRRLVFPDYGGNDHFNTLGNLELDPAAGLLFVDFASGGLLQLSGRAEVDWNTPDQAIHPGARRLVSFEVEGAVELRGALPLRWTDVAADRPLRVRETVRESDEVVSFVLESEDGAPLPGFEPGQHLPIVLEVPGHSEPVRRTYSLSSGPSDSHYRISVKQEALGVASRHLHDALHEGDQLMTRSPAGDFFLQPGDRPVVLVSAGVGVTPMVSMLRAMDAGTDPRTVHFFHVARDGQHHALADEVRGLAGRDGVHLHVSYSRPAASDRAGVAYDSEGRLDVAAIAAALPDLEADFYLCGPPGFMAQLQDGLEERGVAAERIHSESFGPAS